MADSDPVELIKLLGGIAGLATAAFTIYDRAIRGRPTANLSAIAPEMWAGVPGTVFLVIRNPSDRDILIEEIATGREPKVVVGTDETVTSLIRASMGLKYASVIAAKSERVYPIHFSRDEVTDLPVTFTVAWQPVTAHYLSRVPLRIRASTGRLRMLAQEAEHRREAARELSRQL